MRKVLTVMTMVLVLACAAVADYIPIGNAGFETPAISPATSTTTITPWMDSVGGSIGTGTSKIFYSTSGPTAIEGNNVYTMSGLQEIYQELSDTFQANTRYILSAGTARSPWNPGAGPAEFEITLSAGSYASATTVGSAASQPVNGFSNNSWRTRRVIYTTGTTESFLGHPITIELGNPLANGSRWQQFDDVQLEALPLDAMVMDVENGGFEESVTAFGTTDPNLGDPNTGWQKITVLNTTPAMTYHSGANLRPYEGAQTVRLNGGGNAIYQDLDENYTANTLYTMMAQVGTTPYSSVVNPSMDISFNDGGTILSSRSQAARKDALQFFGVNTSLTTGAADSFLGNPVRVQLANNSGGGGCWMEADDVFVFKTPAVNGTWNVDADGYYWDSSNWSSGAIAAGADRTATFSAGLTADRTVELAFPMMLGNLVFDDTAGQANDWTLSGLDLTLQGTSKPDIDVAAGDTAAIASQLYGDQGFTKSGAGTLALTTASNLTLSGGIDVNAGTLKVEAQHGAGDNDVTVADGAAVELAGNNNTGPDPFGDVWTWTLQGTGVANDGVLRKTTSFSLAFNYPITIT